MKLFDTALEKLSTVKEVTWRGVSLDVGKIYSENQLITWWSINSCSSSVNVIKAFVENTQNSTLFLIEATNGKKIRGLIRNLKMKSSSKDVTTEIYSNRFIVFR